MDALCWYISMRNIIVEISFVVVFLLLSTLVSASTLEQSNINSTDQINQSLDHSAQWGVSQEDWKRYQQVMEVKGKYLYKDLDPVTVLGLTARTDAERDRYAETLAKQEFANTRALVLLDQAYNRAFSRLYGHIPVVDPSQINQARAVLNTVSTSKVRGKPGDRYIVFASTDCAACDRKVSSVLSELMIGVSIDVHFNGDTRKAITEWAARMKISPDAVANGKITLNPNSELYAKFGNPNPPALYFYDKSANQVSEVE